MSKLRHEIAYRGQKSMEALSKASVFIFGCGAIGSNLAVNLARCGVGELTLIDFDRVEEHNIGTQAYSYEDIGSLKAEALEASIYRDCGLTAVKGLVYKIKDIKDVLKAFPVNTFLPSQHMIMVDCFDNAASRRILYTFCELGYRPPCLHTGLNGEFGEIKWNEQYKVPSGFGEDVCEYPLARTLIGLVVNIATESLIRYVTAGVKENYSVTLADMKINKEEI